GGGALEQIVKPVRLGVGGPLGAGDQYMPWIHLDDVVRVFVEATGDARYEGVFNAAAPAPATNAELTRALGAVLRRPTLFRVPRFALKLAVGELAEVLLGGQRMIPRRLGELGFRFEHPALAGALEDLLGS
ncbi:MAG: DUF1731 domain-containing protein, partial [Myxococcales bacterium]|nr:DUF1731 domain-containing protein [Myxococcales bacterium]